MAFPVKEQAHFTAEAYGNSGLGPSSQGQLKVTAGIPDSKASAFISYLVLSRPDNFIFLQLFKANMEHLKGDIFWSL